MNRKFQQHRARWGRFHAAVKAATWVALYHNQAVHVPEGEKNGLGLGQSARVLRAWDPADARFAICGVKLDGMEHTPYPSQSKCKRCLRVLGAA